MSAPTTPAGAPVTPERLMQFAFAYAPPLMIEAALRHRVFDLLDGGPKTVEEISRESGASERGLRAIMNALVGLGLLAKEGADRYRLTPESAAFLISTKPAYHGGFFEHASRQLIPNWLRLPEVVGTGRPAADVHSEGESAAFFTEFVEAIMPMSVPAARALAQELGLAHASAPVRVLDVGAGAGVWGVTLAQASPHVQVTAVDWPDVLAVTRRVAARFGVGDRLACIEGNMREVDFGTGYDVATIGHILHGEGAARSRTLLQKVSDALAPGGTVAIAEFLVNQERTGPPNGLIFAVNMLVNTEEGDTFSFEEIREWLEASGFTDVRPLEAPGPSPLILATKKHV